MLEELDEIEWGELEGAYGSAADVPTWLRELASDDPEQRKNGRYWIEAALLHQGTVYEASVEALPFLIELAQNPSVKDRGWILHTIAGMAGAYDGRTQFYGIPFEKIFPRVNDIWSNEQQRCYYAVEPQTGALAELLKDADPEVRALTAFLLSQFSRMRFQNRDFLESALASEQDPGVRMSIVNALVLLDHYQADEARWEELKADLTLDASVSIERSALAAYCMFRYPVAAKSVALRRTLVELFERALLSPTPLPQIPNLIWENGDVLAMLSSAAEEIDDTETRRYMAERLLPVLDRIREPEAWQKNMARTALYRVYTGSTTYAPPEGGWPSAEQTPPALRNLLVKVLENPALLTPNLLKALPNDGLADDVDALRAFFGVADPDATLDAEIEHEGQKVSVRSLLPKLKTGGKGSVTTMNYGKMKVTFTAGDKDPEEDAFRLPLAAFAGRDDSLHIAFALAARGVDEARQLSAQAFSENPAQALSQAAVLAKKLSAEGLPTTISTFGTAVHHGAGTQLLALTAAHCAPDKTVPPEELDALVRLGLYDGAEHFDATCLYLSLLPQERRDLIIEQWAQADWSDGLSGGRLSESPNDEQREALARLMSPAKAAVVRPEKAKAAASKADKSEGKEGGFFASIAGLFRSMFGGN